MGEKELYCRMVQQYFQLTPDGIVYRSQVLPTGAVEIAGYPAATHLGHGIELSIAEEYRAGRFWSGHPEGATTVQVDFLRPHLLLAVVFPYYVVRQPDTWKFRLGRIGNAFVDPLAELRGKRLCRTGPFLNALEDEEGDYRLARQLRQTLEHYHCQQFKNPIREGK